MFEWWASLEFCEKIVMGGSGFVILFVVANLAVDLLVGRGPRQDWIR